MKSKLKSAPRAGAKLAMLSSSALLALAMSTAYAQEAPAEEAVDSSEEDVIVVKGIRKSLQTARDVKRNSDTFVDSITSSDVTQLPDLSVAEALARVPGVVTQRFELGGSDGDFPAPEGSGNIVRGLQYVSSEFNGREAFSASQGRSLEWASIPPELIGAVDVFKTQSADMLEGGIAGVVNLRTLEPFDRTGRVGVVVLDGTYTDLAEEFSPGASVVLGERWENEGGEFGLLGSFSTSTLASAVNGFQYGQLLALPHPDAGNDSTIAMPGGFQARDVEYERERDSYYLVGQWRSPDGDKEVTLKYIRAENETQSDERTLEWFTDGESWRNWEFIGDDYTITPWTSAGIPQCNGNGEVANGGPGTCEILETVDGGLFEAGIVSNGLRDWLGVDGTLGTPLSGLAVSDFKESVTEDWSANVKWRATDQLYVELDAQYTKSSAERVMLWAGTNVFADYEFDFTDLENPEVRLFLDDSMQVQEWAVRGGNGVAPTTLSDPATSFLLFAADEFQENDGDMKAFRADATYEFENDGWFEAVKFGARFADREQTIRQAGLNWAGIAPPWNGGYLPFGNTTDQNSYEVFDYSDFGRGGIFQGDSTSVVFPARSLINDYDAFVDFVNNEPLISDGFTPDWVPLRTDGVVDYGRGNDQIGVSGFAGDDTISEKTTNFYVRFDFANDFDNGQSVNGNFGVRYVRSEIESAGTVVYSEIANNNVDGQNPIDFVPELVAYMSTSSETTVVDRETTYVLPSFNMKWNLNDEMLLRFGASQAISRPNMASLTANGGAFAPLFFETETDSSVTPPTVTTSNISSQGNIIINGGNPQLEPIEANNLDLSYEYYFGEDGQFTVSYFYKDLKNIIVYGEENQGSVNLDGVDIALDFRGEINLNDGTVQGVEVAYQQFFTEAPGLLANFGLQANYTFLTSETEELASVQDSDGDGVADNFLTTYRWGVKELLGLSEHNYNLIGIYQTDKFEGRLAYNWRSEYFSSYRDFITGNPIIQDDIGFLDASLKYDLTENLQVRLQGANLLDTKAVALQQVDAAGQTYGRSVFTNDRRFEVGVRYAF